jgi:hypothetical protein
MMVIFLYTARKVSENKSCIVEWWMKIAFFRMWCFVIVWQRYTRVSEESAGSVFRVKEQRWKQQIALKWLELSTRLHNITIPEDNNLRIHRHENLRTLIEWCIFQIHFLRYLDLWLICWQIWSMAILFQNIGADITCSFCVVKHTPYQWCLNKMHNPRHVLCYTLIF